MTDTLPAPLTPPDCDLQDFSFMPLDVGRLRDSDLASDETPEACWAAVLLWCASWHQIPAASIPDNEQWLAKQAGYAQRGKISEDWAAVKPGAMRGWIKCSDGRLYHPVVAEKAIEAWESKRDQRWRTECARIKKHNDRHGTSIPRPSFEQWVSQGCPTGQRLPVPEDNWQSSQGTGTYVPGETGSKGQGEGQGQGQGQGQINTKGAKAPSSPAVLTTAPPPRSESDEPEDHAIAPACPLKQIVGVFAVKCPTLPKPRYEMWKDSAAAEAMRQRWKWLLSPDAVREDGSRYANTPAEALDWFGRFFEAAHDSDFLSGRSGSWKHCDLGWLMKRENFMKVVQGNYTNKDTHERAH